MGELPYMSQVPTGYSKESEDWSSSGALLQRVNFALEMAGGEMRGVRIPADVRQAAGDRPAAGDRAGAAGGIEAGDGDPGFIAEAVVGWIYPGMKAEEAEALARAIAVELAPEDDSPQAMWTTALGLALGAPAFQQR